MRYVKNLEAIYIHSGDLIASLEKHGKYQELVKNLRKYIVLVANDKGDSE